MEACGCGTRFPPAAPESRSKGDFNKMKKTSLLGRTAVAAVLVTTAVVTVWAAATSSLKNQGRTEKTIDQAVKVINGTWKLDKRINSDGTTHVKVDGITTIDLATINTKLLGDIALGTVQAREHGE